MTAAVAAMWGSSFLWIAIAIDQLLGPDTGRVFNDASADIAAGNMTAEQAAKAVQKSWEQNKE